VLKHREGKWWGSNKTEGENESKEIDLEKVSTPKYK
jgi:hypothetical protein